TARTSDRGSPDTVALRRTRTGETAKILLRPLAVGLQTPRHPTRADPATRRVWETKRPTSESPHSSMQPLTEDLWSPAPAGPWYAQVSRDQWRAFWAAVLSWALDSFDFNVLTFVLIDIQQSMTIDRALAGALGTVTLVMRLVGGTASGVAADR